jgi:hypothetical protein
VVKEEGMKIFIIIFDGCEDGANVYAVYTDEKTAVREFVQLETDTKGQKWHHYHISEWDIETNKEQRCWEISRDEGLTVHDPVTREWTKYNLEGETSMKFRKKPVVVEAVQWLNRQIVCPPGPEWFVRAEESKAIRLCGDELLIKTLEGEMTASVGDWIIRGVKGEIYPCKPDIFEETYEPVVD